MYYSHPCPYCSKIFYVFSDDRNNASKMLYDGIKRHMTEYGEEDKEFTMDEGPEKEANQIYNAMTESAETPSGGYLIE